MTGFDINEPNPHHYFPEGSEVEVSSDEEGFKGAWFRAFVVENPASNPASKKRKKVLVEYWNLVTEDGSQQLRESVDLGYLRPLPPDTGVEEFEVGDVVDADYRDGWWTGVVKKVLPNFKYRVFFENPPDLIEFNQNQMRIHQDWVTGKWVRPERHKQMTGSTFSPGTDVEVNFENEDLCDAWVPAIVVKENEDNTFLVKYHNSKAKHWKDTVDFLHIRPPAPRYADRTYELREKVDAFCDFAWRAGEITKILAGKMYTVTFNRGMKSKELSHAEIRPLVEWKDGKWDMGSKEVLVASNSNLHEELDNGAKNDNNADKASQLESLVAADGNLEKKTPHPTNSGKNRREQSTDCNGDSVSSVLTSSVKKITKSSPNHGARRVNSSKKSEDETAAESPLSDKKYRVKKQTLGALTTSATREIGLTRLRKPVVPFKIESCGKRTQRQKSDAVYIQKKRIVKHRGGRPKRSQVKSPPTSAVGKRNASAAAAKKFVDKKKIRKGAELPIKITSSTEGKGLLAENSHLSPSEEELPPIDLKKNQGKGSLAENSRLSLSEEVLPPIDLKKNPNDSAEYRNTELKQQQAGGSSSKRKRGRPRKLLVSCSEASEGDKHVNGAGHGEESGVNACPIVALPIQGVVETAEFQDTSKRRRTDVSGAKCLTKEGGTISNRDSNSIDDDDRPLSMWFGQASVTEARTLGKIVDQRNRDRERADIAKDSVATHALNESPPEENQRLPFSKSSPIWKAIESMEVFRTIPQSPHFRPLYKCKEEYREGLAIGNMVTFSGLVDKISKLQFDDRGSLFNSILESLNDLEKHGFSVSFLRSRVNELLSIKDRQEQFRGESKDAEDQITEHTSEKTKLSEEIDEISKKISELQEKHALIKSQLETKDLEMSKLQRRLDAINQSIDSARIDFEKLAAAPLKSV